MRNAGIGRDGGTCRSCPAVRDSGEHGNKAQSLRFALLNAKLTELHGFVSSDTLALDSILHNLKLPNLRILLHSRNLGTYPKYYTCTGGYLFPRTCFRVNAIHALATDLALNPVNRAPFSKVIPTFSFRIDARRHEQRKRRPVARFPSPQQPPRHHSHHSHLWQFSQPRWYVLQSLFSCHWPFAHLSQIWLLPRS